MYCIATVEKYKIQTMESLFIQFSDDVLISKLKN